MGIILSESRNLKLAAASRLGVDLSGAVLSAPAAMDLVEDKTDIIDQVRCPSLIVNGMNDDNSPPSIIDIYVKALRRAGKHVETHMSERGLTVTFDGRIFPSGRSRRARTGVLREMLLEAGDRDCG